MLWMNDKKYFRGMLFSIGGLFAVTCFSIIYCILNSTSIQDDQTTSHVMSIVYMILQLGMEGLVFYYVFKAMVNGSSLIKIVMYSNDEFPNPKSKRNSLIFFIVSTIISIYMIVIIFPLDIFLSFFVLGLKFALLNFFSLVAIISIYFFCYKAERKE